MSGEEKLKLFEKSWKFLSLNLIENFFACDESIDLLLRKKEAWIERPNLVSL